MIEKGNKLEVMINDTLIDELYQGERIVKTCGYEYWEDVITNYSKEVLWNQGNFVLKFKVNLSAYDRSFGMRDIKFYINYCSHMCGVCVGDTTCT